MKKKSSAVSKKGVKKIPYEGDLLTGKPLKEFDRTKVEGTVDVREYIDELRSARHLTDKDYSVRITVRG